MTPEQLAEQIYERFWLCETHNKEQTVDRMEEIFHEFLVQERQRIKAKIKTLNPIELKTPMATIVAVNDILEEE